MLSLLDRYRLASDVTAPRLAASTPEVLVDGYWLGNRMFFHLEEQRLSCGLLAGVPCLADALDGTTKELFSPEDLVKLLADHTGRNVEEQWLSDAEFEMPDSRHLAVRIKGFWYVIDWQRRTVIDSTPAFEASALYSPNGEYGCFVRGFDLWLKDLNTGAERPLTSDGTEDDSYGREPDTCLSAISYRRRPYPVGLWSPDSQWFITHRVEQGAVPDSAMVQHAPEEGRRPILHAFKYPVPGDPLPVATFLAIHIPSGAAVVIDNLSDLIAVDSAFTEQRMWFTDNRRVCLIRSDRHFKKAELFEIDLESGASRCLLSETVAAGYLELNTIFGTTPNVRTFPAAKKVIWYSERDGWGHLYRYDSSTEELEGRITGGAWLVRDIVHVDQARQTVFFLAGGLDPGADPARRSLCSIGLDGRNFEVLVRHDGDLSVPVSRPQGQDQSRRFRPSSACAGVSPDGQFAAIKKTSPRWGNRAEIVTLSTGRAFAIAEVRPTAGEKLPEDVTALAMDGSTRLHGAMFFPPDFDPSKRYPLVDYIYPGPQIAHKPQSYRSAAAGPACSLAALGFVTLMLDTRGAPIGSRSFHQCGYPSVKEPQLSDHAAVVRQLCDRYSFLDRERVGIMGYSGGGSATVKALCDYPEVYRVGVAASGEYDPSLYTSFWSDKYCGPVAPDARATHRAAANAERMKGKLQLIAADMDENVPISQTFSLISALIQANRNFDLVIIPNSNHGAFLENGYVLRRVWDYFVRNLLDCEPPDPDEITLDFSPHELDRMLKQLLRKG